MASVQQQTSICYVRFFDRFLRRRTIRQRIGNIEWNLSVPDGWAHTQAQIPIVIEWLLLLSLVLNPPPLAFSTSYLPKNRKTECDKVLEGQVFGCPGKDEVTARRSLDHVIECIECPCNHTYNHTIMFVKAIIILRLKFQNLPSNLIIIVIIIMCYICVQTFVVSSPTSLSLCCSYTTIIITFFSL